VARSSVAASRDADSLALDTALRTVTSKETKFFVLFSGAFVVADRCLEQYLWMLPDEGESNNPKLLRAETTNSPRSARAGIRVDIRTCTGFALSLSLSLSLSLTKNFTTSSTLTPPSPTRTQNWAGDGEGLGGGLGGAPGRCNPLGVSGEIVTDEPSTEEK